MRRENPYDKFLGKEDVLHAQVVGYLRWQHKDILCIHPPNEGKRTGFEQYKAKKLGLTAGIPDLLIFDARGPFAGLAIELKVHPNKPTLAQMLCMKRLMERGWQCSVCYSFEAAKAVLEKYLSDKPLKQNYINHEKNIDHRAAAA